MEDGKRTRAMQIIEAVAASPGQTLRKQIDSCKQRLAAADAAAKSKGDAKRRLYLVNYRVSETNSRTKGMSDERRNGLIEIIQSLNRHERHQSTSSWLMSLYLDAKAIGPFLLPVLDETVDGLHVSQVDPKNRMSWGTNDLDS